MTTLLQYQQGMMFVAVVAMLAHFPSVIPCRHDHFSAIVIMIMPALVALVVVFVVVAAVAASEQPEVLVCRSTDVRWCYLRRC